MEATKAATTRSTPPEELPPCYGLYWEAVGDSPCTKCDERLRCLHAFATQELPRLQTKLGAAAGDLTRLASKSQVKEAALRVAIAYAKKNASNGKPKRRAPPARTAATTSTEEVRKKDEPEQCARGAHSPKGRGQPPTKARKGSGGRRRRTRRRGRPWGKHTFEARWVRERTRSPAIGKLTPGHNIVREYRGTNHTVHVLLGRYVYEGKEYPTLYAVTKAITGTKPAKKQRRTSGDENSRPEGKRKLCSWSATRFFAAALEAVA